MLQFSDQLPLKFAEQLEKVYGIETINRVDTLAAAQNRLSNEWTEFIRSLNEGSGVISGFFKTIITEISETIKWWSDVISFKKGAKEKLQKHSDIPLRDDNKKHK